MNRPYQSLVAARILAIEAAAGRKLQTTFGKRALEASLFHLHVVLRQKPGGLRDRIFRFIWDQCRASRGLDVAIGANDMIAAVGVKAHEPVRLATIWLERHGLIVRLARPGGETRFAICVPSVEAAA